jgi:hypothetical protein
VFELQEKMDNLKNSSLTSAKALSHDLQMAKSDLMTMQFIAIGSTIDDSMDNIVESLGVSQPDGSKYITLFSNYDILHQIYDIEHSSEKESMYNKLQDKGVPLKVHRERLFVLTLEDVLEECQTFESFGGEKFSVRIACSEGCIPVR